MAQDPAQANNESKQKISDGFEKNVEGPSSGLRKALTSSPILIYPQPDEAIHLGRCCRCVIHNGFERVLLASDDQTSVSAGMEMLMPLSMKTDAPEKLPSLVPRGRDQMRRRVARHMDNNFNSDRHPIPGVTEQALRRPDGGS
ncbi:hypothetical protein TNCV_1631701 [Trichonephila clavipes]|nr:hypothetical protein TNCV_1631701 [Trichonephila clavipes]